MMDMKNIETLVEHRKEMRRYKVKWMAIDAIAAAALAPILCWLFRLLEGIG